MICIESIPSTLHNSYLKCQTLKWRTPDISNQSNHMLLVLDLLALYQQIESKVIELVPLIRATVAFLLK